jgi:hypothetical protein
MRDLPLKKESLRRIYAVSFDYQQMKLSLIFFRIETWNLVIQSLLGRSLYFKWFVLLNYFPISLVERIKQNIAQATSATTNKSRTAATKSRSSKAQSLGILPKAPSSTALSTGKAGRSAIQPTSAPSAFTSAPLTGANPRPISRMGEFYAGMEDPVLQRRLLKSITSCRLFQYKDETTAAVSQSIVLNLNEKLEYLPPS